MWQSYMFEELKESEKLIKKIDILEIDILKNLLNIFQNKKIIITGMGSSFFLAEICKYMFEHIWKMKNIYVCSADNLSENFPFIDNNDTIVTFSQSWNTKEVSQILSAYKNTFALVNNKQWKHNILAKNFYNIGIEKEKSPVSTKYVVYMILFFYKFSYFLQQKNIDLYDLQKFSKTIFDKNKEILEKEVSKFQKGDNFMIIWNGLQYFLAKELSLKIRETVGITSSYDNFWQLNHWWINSIDNKTICILLNKNKVVEQKITERWWKIIILYQNISKDIYNEIIKQIIIWDFFIYLLSVYLQIDTNKKLW